MGWPAVVGAVGEVAAGATAALRVSAGAHSWSDVGTAFVAGNALGAAMCLLHPADATTPPPVSLGVSSGLVSVEARF